MCDYSLEAYRSQPAVTGERYVLDQFPSGSKGFTTQRGCTTAVCMAADARLRLEGIPYALQEAHGIGAVEEVTMIRREPGPYHDGVKFRNGHEILLQALDRGVRATVLPVQIDIGNALGIGDRVRELMPA
jgi:hypothetical protein